MFKIGEPSNWRDTEMLDIVKEIENPTNNIKFKGKSVKGLIKEVAKKGQYDISQDKITFIIGLRRIELNIAGFDIESKKPSKEELILKNLEVFK